MSLLNKVRGFLRVLVRDKVGQGIATIRAFFEQKNTD